MKRLFILVLLVCAGNVFGAASSSSAAASSSSAAASSSSAGLQKNQIAHEDHIGMAIPMHRESLYQLCLYALIKGFKIREAEDVEQPEIKQKVWVYTWRCDLRRNIALLNACFKWHMREMSQLVWDKDGANERVLNLLLKKGANPNTPYGARGYEKIPLLRALTAEKPNLVTALLNAGADCNVSCRYDGSPLHILYHFNNSLSDDIHSFQRFIEVFIEAKVDVNKQDCHGDTPLHAFCKCIEFWASRYQWSRQCYTHFRKSQMFWLIERLIKAGAKLGIRNNDGDTILDILQKARNVYDLYPTGSFFEAPVCQKEEGDYIALLDHVIAFLYGRIDPNQQDELGRTQLHRYAQQIIYGIQAGSPRSACIIPVIISELKNAGANPSIKDINGQTPVDLLGQAKLAIGRTTAYRDPSLGGRTLEYERELVEALDQAIQLLGGNPSDYNESSCTVQ